MINIFSTFNEWGVLVLRLVFGVVFLFHGWHKLRNLKGTQEWFHSIGFKPGVIWGTFVALLETFGSVAIMAGFYTQIVAALLVGVMIGAILWRVRSGHKFYNGYEFELSLLAMALFLATNGGGAYGLDNYLSL